MRATIAMLVVAVCVGHAAAADEPAPPPARAIRLPEFVSSDQPKPPPSAVTTLRAGELYVIDSDVQLLCLSSPAGVLTAVEESGPIKISGVFVDAKKVGQRETRTYKGKWVYSIEPVPTDDPSKQVRQAELIVVPVGVKAETEILRRMLTVVGPQPPPVDPVNPVIPPVDPVKPPVPLTPFQTKAKAAFLADGATVKELATYAAVWRGAGKTTAYDPGLATPAAVLTEIQAGMANLSKGTPPAVRHGILNQTARAVAEELNPLMPTPASGTLTKVTRDAMATVFARIAADLDTAGGSK